MKLFKVNKKVAAIGLAAGIALGAGGIAAAYFTSSGSGTGTATVGTTNPFKVTVTESTTPAKDKALEPTGIGDNNATVDTETYVVANKTEADVYLHTVVVTVTGTSNGSCLASWFAINGGSTTATIPVTETLKPTTDGTAGKYKGSFTVQLVNANATQDACKTATVTLTVSAS